MFADWGNDPGADVQLRRRAMCRSSLGDAGLSKIAREYMLTNAVPNRLRDMANVELQKYLRRPKVGYGIRRRASVSYRITCRIGCRSIRRK